jgi:hypothetical protein
MAKLIVTPAWSDPGNCREYYWVREIHNDEGEVKEPKNLLICSQDEGPYVEWYRSTNDGCWYEPESPIKRTFDIYTTKGELLRGIEKPKPEGTNQ